MAWLHFLLWVIFQLWLQHANARSWCKPEQGCWPNQQIWTEFNNSLHGKLLAAHPSAFYCHYPNYDRNLCQIATANWSNAFWRADQVGAMQSPHWEAFQDQTCPINSDPNIPCYQGAVPTYAVNVTQAQDVQKSFKFAARHNIRLVVKNTGHDFLGRSTAPGSLIIWLHNMKKIKFEGSFVADGCSAKEEAALTAEAGVQWRDLYKVAQENNVLVVGAFQASVGVAGGYVQGGGHGVLSRFFGLAADNALQFTIATPDGKLQIVNQCQNQELFWALRGGGGGTFGIVISVTFRTFPSFQNVIGASYTITSNNSSHIQNLLYQSTSLTPQLADFGWSGFFTVTFTSFTFYYIVPNKNLSSAQASLAPLLDYITSHPHLNLTNKAFRTYSPFEAYYLYIYDSVVGSNMILASRLIPQTVIEQKPRTLTQIIMDGLRNETNFVVYIYGVLVAAGNVSVYRNNAVNPSWRKALWSLTFVSQFAQNSSSAQRRSYIEKLSNINAPLRNLVPESGAYLNEADYIEPNWQESFFGSNYARLLRIKQKIDPFALLTCHLCVGSEDEDKVP